MAMAHRQAQAHALAQGLQVYTGTIGTHLYLLLEKFRARDVCVFDSSMYVCS